MPPRPGKVRRAKMGPRFSATSTSQQPRFFRGAEDILAHPQKYLQGAINEQENERIPFSSQIDTDAAHPEAQLPVPGHQSTQSSSISQPTSTSGPPPVESPPSPTPPFGGSFEFPAFHLTTPPSPPRPTSPPFEHPSVLLHPNTVPYQETPRSGAREAGHVFQPAPQRPIYLSNVSTSLPRPEALP